MASNSDNSRVFNTNLETVEYFLERFKVQQHDALTKANTDSHRRAMFRANALPINIFTDIQRRLKPTLLTAATYEHIERHLIASYSVKKSVIGAAMQFIIRKQQSGETIETYTKVLNELASQCEYSDCCRDRMLRDVFISGLRSPRLISVLITECEKKSLANV